jgi:hypothetical protein
MPLRRRKDKDDFTLDLAKERSMVGGAEVAP